VDGPGGGAAVEGPTREATSGGYDTMLACPPGGGDAYARFNGNNGAFSADKTAVYKDNVESYSTTEPAIDLTASSFLMFSWRQAGAPVGWTSTSVRWHGSHLVATVRSTGRHALRGKVSFHLGGRNGPLLGTARLRPNGRATLSVPGAASVVATYSGDNHNGPSVSLPTRR